MTIFYFNFGQDSSFAGNKTAQGNQDGNSVGDFYYEPPTDFLALCTSNLSDASASIKLPGDNFNTVLYTVMVLVLQLNNWCWAFSPIWSWAKQEGC